MAPKKSKANPRDQYFQSIKSQKLDTLRWCLRHGGVSHRAEDDEGHNGLMVAAAGGFDESLELLIDQLKRVGELRDVDDPDEEGRTPLMMAAHNGKLDCVRLLVLKAKGGEALFFERPKRQWVVLLGDSIVVHEEVRRGTRVPHATPPHRPRSNAFSASRANARARYYPRTRT